METFFFFIITLISIILHDQSEFLFFQDISVRSRTKLLLESWLTCWKKYAKYENVRKMLWWFSKLVFLWPLLKKGRSSIFFFFFSSKKKVYLNSCNPHLNSLCFWQSNTTKCHNKQWSTNLWLENRWLSSTNRSFPSTFPRLCLLPPNLLFLHLPSLRCLPSSFRKG